MLCPIWGFMMMTHQAVNESYTTIIQPTRYSRNVRVHWPFNKFRLFTDKDRKRTAPAVHAAALTAELVKAGYAVVVVDIRGTGVRQLRHNLRPFLVHFSAPSHPTRTV